MDQWPLATGKIQTVKSLVQEQLKKGHLEECKSSWNIPVFVTKKKSGKWRLLQNLRTIHETMYDTGAQQSGLPSPTAVPQGYYIIVIDLQDCFITIILDPKNS